MSGWFAEFLMRTLTNLVYLAPVVALFNELKEGKISLKLRLILIALLALIQAATGILSHGQSLVGLLLVNSCELLIIFLVINLFFRRNCWQLMGVYCAAYLFFSIVTTIMGPFRFSSIENIPNLLIYLKWLMLSGLFLAALSCYILCWHKSFLKRVKLSLTRKRVMVALIAYSVNQLAVFVIEEYLLETLQMNRSASDLLVKAFMITLYFLLIMLATTEVHFCYQQTQVITGQMTILQQVTYMIQLEAVQKEMEQLQSEYQEELGRQCLDGFDEQLKAGHVQLLNGMGAAHKEIEFDIRQATHLSAIRITDIRSLVLTKLVEMEKHQIFFKLEVEKEIKQCRMPVTDLIRCLGILSDNAIEAVGCLREPEVILKMIQTDGELLIIVQNPFGETEPTEEIWQSGFSTKGDNRGLGLASYQKIVDNYQNVKKETDIVNGFFSQTLKIVS